MPKRLLFPQPHARFAAVFGDELGAPELELIAILGTPRLRAAFRTRLKMKEVMPEGE
jgi:hypothetical protein